MRTLRLRVDPGEPETAALSVAAGILRRGGTVAFATETVYGLGANALDPAAVEKIFIAKQRPSWDPLIVHIADRSMLASVASEVPEAARSLIDAFWPGPLTLLLPRHADVPDAVTAGRALVGVRMPAHPVARALIRAAGVPVAAPSANTFGHVSPTSAAHVAADLEGRVDAIVDSGETLHGLESTVLDVSVSPCVLYRPGAVTLAQIQAIVPETVAYVEVTQSGPPVSPESLPSPGVGLRHYAPRARLMLIEGEGVTQAEAFSQAVSETLESASETKSKVGILLPQGLLGGHLFNAASAIVYNWGQWEDLAILAQRLFAGLRWLDDQGVAVILCPLPSTEGLGDALRDRLRKAARRS